MLLQEERDKSIDRQVNQRVPPVGYPALGKGKRGTKCERIENDGNKATKGQYKTNLCGRAMKFVNTDADVCANSLGHLGMCTKVAVLLCIRL